MKKILVVLFLLYSVKAEAVIAPVPDPDNCVNASGTSGTATVSKTTTAHNTIFVFLNRDGDTSAATQSPVTDTLSSRVSVAGSGVGSATYTNYDVGGGSTAYTFTFTSTTWRIAACEFSGMDTTQTATDGTAGTLGFTSSPTPFTVTAGGATTNANDLIIADWNLNGSGSTSVVSTLGNDASPWTRPASGTVITGGSVEFVIAYIIVSATGTYGCTLITADGISGDATVGAYKAAAAAGSSSTHNSLILGVGR